MSGMLRTRWAAIGAAVAVTLGAGGVSLTQAAIGSGEKPVFVPIEPCRLVDTRPATQIGPKSTPLGPNETITIVVTGSTGQCSGIPTAAAGAAMNMTAIQPTAQSFLTVYPSGSDRPNASNLNWGAGVPPTPNKVDVALGPDGAIDVYNSIGTVHLAADLVGYYVDHHHDDRYYTKAQVDVALADTPRALWAVVGSDGSLVRGTPGATAAQLFKPINGAYEVAFGTDVTECVLIATLGRTDAQDANPDPGEIGTAYRNGDPDAVFVKTYDSTGAAADRSFHLSVLC